ncbi:MAG: helix-turn-helix domain-containing protein [Clostridia bacterium]|nr:helix-turn-helix domain-containing protein [Clostridia bacterium]
MKSEEERKFVRDPLVFQSKRHTDVECITHLHAHLEIVLVTEGVLDMTISGKSYKIPAGCGTFIAQFEPHTFKSITKNECHVLMFSAELVGSFFDHIKKKCISSHIFAISDEALSIVNRLLPYESNKTDPITAEAILAPLCLDAYRGCSFEERPITAFDTAFKIFEYMFLHFKEEISLSSVAEALGIHPVTVSKSFSKYAGVGFNYYVQYLRCVYAAELITNTSMSLTEIAYESGFGSVRSFNRAFRGLYGITPGEYREK